eukprot:g11945.t1
MSIWDEVLDGNLAGIRSLLEDGVGVDERNWLGEAPLHLAARYGLEDVATALIDAGASVHIKDYESGWTPLHRSLYFGHVRLSLLLLKAGALMDVERDQPGREDRHKQRTRSRSRSESIALPSDCKSRAAGYRRQNDDLADGEGNSPLDVLSLELRPQLKAARESGLGGDVFSFGKADFTLGYDSFGRADVVRPRRIEALANLHVVRVSASRHHSAAVTKCGRLYTWGHGKSGRLGHGHEGTCMLPTRVEGLVLQAVIEVATAESHTAALTSSGALYTWGRDRFGQLGHGSSGSNARLVPKRVESLKKFTVVGVAAGTEHTAIVTLSGNCYTFGRNNHGQLGLAGVKETRSPRLVAGLSNGASRGAGGVGRHVMKVSASARSTMAITRGVDRGSGLHRVNEVFCWGLGLTLPSRVNFNMKEASSSSSRWQTHDDRVDIIDIAAARCHNIALDRIGRVFSWGFGADNLGLQPRESRTERGPKLVAGLLPFNCGGNPVQISASDQHSCVVTDAGDLFTWGTCDEEGGALGHSHERWQPVAKRVPLLKKVTSVAAAPNHTVVLCAASCPSLPHGASFPSVGPASGAHVDGDDALTEEAGDGTEEDLDSDGDEEGLGDAASKIEGLYGFFSVNAGGGFEPLTLKQLCEAKLAQEVDLHNAGAVLAYADALDAPELVRFCAEFIRWNLDGILVMGRESDRSCLLEASASGMARSLLCGARARMPAVQASAAKGAAPLNDHEAEEGLDRELQAIALARAEMRSKTPSAKVAARAVRSLRKKIARIRQWELARERGEELSEEQVSKVSQKARMEAELTSLGSQLERARMAHEARCSRLEAGKPSETEACPQSKRVLFPDEIGVGGNHPTLDPDLQAGKTDQWTPQLDLSHETKANDKRPITCEACSVECANESMYADHLRGKRHRAKILRLEQQLKAAQPDPKVARTWATTLVQDSSAVAAPCATTTPAGAAPAGAQLWGSGKGRRASCPDANLPSWSYRPHRQALEEQQRVATMFMSDKSKAETVDAAHTMDFLCTPAKSQRSPSPQAGAAATPSAVYSLVDFMVTPGNAKPPRRAEGDKGAGKAWGEDVQAGGKSASAAERSSLKTPKKSFQEILEEEAKAKEEREDYGGTGAWFVSGKPRSTSFESIVQQQRREERFAEEEQLRKMEEEMLKVALEMSKHEARPKPTPSHPHSKGSRKGRGAKSESRPRKHSSTCFQPQQNRHGRRKRTTEMDAAGPSNT